MTAKHFVLWVHGDRTTSRNAYRYGQASWRNDEANSVPEELVVALGWEDWQTADNGPFPAFADHKITDVAAWLVNHGYTAIEFDGPLA